MRINHAHPIWGRNAPAPRPRSVIALQRRRSYRFHLRWRATSEQIWALLPPPRPTSPNAQEHRAGRECESRRRGWRRCLRNRRRGLAVYACGTGGAGFRRACHQGAVRGFPRLLRSCQGSKPLLKCGDAPFPGRAQGCSAIREPAGKLRISHMSGVPLPARRRTGLNIHAYMSCIHAYMRCVDNRMRVGRFNLKPAAR
jgi:hypothetical protein